MRNVVSFSAGLVGLVGLFGLVGLVTGCSGSGQQSAQNSGGTAGSGGTATTGGGGGDGALCPGPAPATQGATARLDLPVEVTINGAAAEVGVPGTGRDGRQFQLSLFKFFVSQPTLVKADGSSVPAQFVSETGMPEPYEVHLVDADDAATQLLRMVVEPGSYTALSFGVGVPSACNGMGSTAQVYPLNPDSDMFWPWGSQFMFIRIEGTTRASATEAWGPFLYHVGFQPAFTNLTVSGSLSASADAPATGPTLTLDVDLMLKTDADGLPSAQHSVPDGWVVDNLENNQAFSLR